MTRSSSGLVMEIKPDSVLVLTEEGIFLEVPRRDAPADTAVGSIIPVPLGAEWFTTEPDAASGQPAAEVQPRGLSRLTRAFEASSRRWREAAGRRALAAAASVLILLGIGLGLYRQNAAAYEVAIEINPSIILEVNAFDRVVRSRPVNADGAAVLEKVDLEGMAVADALAALVATLKELGFLPAAPQPVLTETLIAAPGGDPAGVEAMADTMAGETVDVEPVEPIDGAPHPGVDGTGAPSATVAISIIPHSRSAAAAAPGEVVRSLENGLLAAASRTGTAFEAVVQVVTSDELAKAREAAGGDASIAKAVLAVKARSRGVNLSDDEIAQVSVPDLARMIEERPPAGDADDQYRLNLFRVQPRDDDDDRDDWRARGRRLRDRGDRDGDAGDHRGRGQGRGRGSAADEGSARPDRGPGRPDDDRGDGHRGRGPADGDGDRDDRGGPPGKGRGNERGRGDSRGDERDRSRDGDDDRRPGRGKERGGGDDDRNPGRGRGRGNDGEGDRPGGGPGRRNGQQGQGRLDRFFDWLPGRPPLFDGFRNR